MPNTVLYSQGSHRNVLIEDFGHGKAGKARENLKGVIPVDVTDQGCDTR